MNVCILGSTGRVGSILLDHSIEHKMNVKVLVRDSFKLPSHSPLIEVITGNVLDKESLDRALHGCDAVLCSLNTDGGYTLSQAMPLIISIMKEKGVKRIITIGTAGILTSRTEPHLYRFQSSESKRKSTKAAEDHLAAYLSLKDSDLHWTIVCPTYLPDGARIGHYRVEKDFLPENPSSISIYDTGDFAFAQLFTEEYYYCRVGLTY